MPGGVFAGTFVRDEIAKNTTEDSLWYIVDHKVYDFTGFLEARSDGNVVLQKVAAG
jgi:cytochrome b involved in lipid metabolism